MTASCPPRHALHSALHPNRATGSVPQVLKRTEICGPNTSLLCKDLIADWVTIATARCGHKPADLSLWSASSNLPSRSDRMVLQGRSRAVKNHRRRRRGLRQREALASCSKLPELN